MTPSLALVRMAMAPVVPIRLSVAGEQSQSRDCGTDHDEFPHCRLLKAWCLCGDPKARVKGPHLHFASPMAPGGQQIRLKPTNPGKYVAMAVRADTCAVGQFQIL